MGDRVGLSLIHCYLGLLALAQGQLDVARRSFLEGLTIAHQSDIKSYTIYNLIGMGNVFSREGKPSKALTLFSAITALASSIGFKIEPELQEPFDQALAEAKQKVFGQEAEAAWKSGETMDIEQAVKFATQN